MGKLFLFITSATSGLRNAILRQLFGMEN